MDLGKINLLVTDGCPSMIGKERGFVSRLVTEYPTVNSLHTASFIRLLCAKLSGKLKEAMDMVIKIVNHIRSISSLQHQLFKGGCVHRSVAAQCCLLERFYALRNEVSEFLSSHQSDKAKHLLANIKDFMAHIAFLCDIMGHLNTLKLQLQGGGKA